MLQRSIVAAARPLLCVLFVAGIAGTGLAEDWTPLWSTAALSIVRENLQAGSAAGKILFGVGKYDYHVGSGGGSGPATKVDIYDASTGSWSTVSTALQVRTSPYGAASEGGKVFFGGGSATSSIVDIYDTATNTWTTANLSQARMSLAATSAGGKVFFAGGTDSVGGSSIVDIYDTVTNNWTTASLSQARSGLVGTAVGNKVFFGGGNVSQYQYSNVVDIYDVATNTWSTATLSKARSGLAATSAGGKAFFGGGKTGTNQLSDVVDIYDTATDTWSTATLSEARSDLAATSAGGKAFFGGGSRVLSPYAIESSMIDIYDTATGLWSTAELSQERKGPAAAATGNLVVFGGGSSYASSSDRVDILALQNYAGITSSKPWTLVDHTTVAGRMQLDAAASLNLGAFNLTVGSMSGAAPINLSGRTLTVGGDGTESVYSGAITGSGILIKTGSGRLTVNAMVAVDGSSSSIQATSGELILGDPLSLTGFSTGGTLSVGTSSVTLRSAGFANLGLLTTLGGGTLTASNGAALGVGDNLRGRGTVVGKIAAAFGSIIVADGGNLNIGDSASVAGFYSDGELYTNHNTVTIRDANFAVLGSLTKLGDGSGGGTLTAATVNPGFLLEQGKNLVGRGQINGNFKNHGDVVGEGTAILDRIVFNATYTVSGKGTFTNTLIMGTFAPGDSPAITNGTNQGFGGTVEFELGGLTPGSGNNNHDQINDTATILLVGGPTLSIKPWNNFVPQVGDEFTVMTWVTGLSGAFGDVQVDPWFTDHGINFAVAYNNPGGAGNLTLTVVPEPASLVFVALGGVLVLGRRRRTV